MQHCSEPSFSMRTGRPFLRLLKGRQGVSQERIELLEKSDPDARIPLRVSLAMLDDAVAHTGDPDLGLRAALATEHGEYDLLEFVAASSATYRESISLMRRYIRLVNDALDLRVECRDGRGIADLEGLLTDIEQHVAKLPDDAELDDLRRTATDFVVATFYLGFVRRARSELTELWKEVWFTHEKPASTRLYTRVFGAARVRFSAPLDGLVFDFVDPELAALAGVTGDGLAVLAGDCDFHVITPLPGCWSRARAPHLACRCARPAGRQGRPLKSMRNTTLRLSFSR